MFERHELGYRMYRTIQKMMTDRGYSVDPRTDPNQGFSLEEFEKKFGSSEGFSFSKLNYMYKNEKEDTIFVYFDDSEKFNAESLKVAKDILDNYGSKRMIIVSKTKITPYTKKAIDSFASSGYKMEYFEFDEVAINITEHELVPKHIPLTDEEKRELLEKYNVTESQLPKIQKSDPVARYLGVTPGQVLKIIRKSETAGEYVTYRLVY